MPRSQDGTDRAGGDSTAVGFFGANLGGSNTLGSITQENVAVRSILIKECSYASGRAKLVRLLLQNDKVTFPDHPEETG